MRGNLPLEQSYNKDYRFLPSVFLGKKLRKQLSNEDLYFVSILREIEGAAASRKSPKWDTTSVFFDITRYTMKARYGFTSYRTNLSLSHLVKAGIITVDSSAEKIRFTPAFSGYERNKSEKKIAYHARVLAGIRIPRCLDEYADLKNQDKLVFSYLLNRCMNAKLFTDEGERCINVSHEEMMEKMAIKSLTTLLSIYERLEKEHLIEREERTTVFTFPDLPRAEKKHLEIMTDEILPQTASLKEEVVIFSTPNFDSKSDSKTCASIKNQEIKIPVQDSLSSDGEMNMQTQKDEGQPTHIPYDANEQIGYAQLVLEHPELKDAIDNILARMEFVYGCRAKTIRVGGSHISTASVKERISRLTKGDVLYTAQWLQQDILKINERNRDNYTLTCLYNFFQTKDWKHDKTEKGSSTVSGGAYKDNKYISSNEYDYEAILEMHRRRLYAQYEANTKK